MNLTYAVTAPNIAVYRIRKGVKGIGNLIGKWFGATQVTSMKPAQRLPEGAHIINYGRSTVPEWDRPDLLWLNRPEAVERAANKVMALELLNEAGVPALKSTTKQEEAQAWLDTNFTVFARLTVNGKKGQGIVVVKPGDELPAAPLYTCSYDKTHEFRVHVFKGQVIDFTQKKKMGKKKRALRGLAKVNMDVRNNGKGWVFAHKDLICDGGHGRGIIEGICISATEVLGMDYAGVDILARFTESGKFLSAVVCEVNSAPGMRCSETREAYQSALANWLNQGG